MDECVAADFATIRSLGFNTVRLYELPSDTVLAAAKDLGLKLIVGIPWTDHVDFLREKKLRTEIQTAIRAAAQRFGNNDTIAALLVGNEIEKTLVRWMGPEKVKRFIESLIDIAHEAAPDCLVSYATYPSTEYLIPANADFVAVNVYLEDRAVFEKYLLRLQNLAGHKPLVITEFGLDAAQHGETKQAEVRHWFDHSSHRHGVAGSVWFSFTDEWFRGGEQVTEWCFGIVDAERRARAAAKPSAEVFSDPCLVSESPITNYQSLNTPSPRLSVVVCTRNGSATLGPCLAALGRQTYPNHEIIVIDDGSTDSVPAIAQSFDFVRYQRQEPSGLSVARNFGASIATGEIIAYTDDDCVPDVDWLQQLALAFDDPQWIAAGGPNIPPPPRNRIEAIVAHAPGGPSHVLINDEEAEHLPGCNLAIRKTALDQIGGFNPIFKTAGDDVDVCWRLRDTGGKLRFCPGAFVWHHRRFTVRAYLRQQRGYGHAEAQLMKVHPQRFGPLGGARWRGLIYGEPGASLPPTEGSIFHGPYGTGAFQVIYSTGGAFGLWDWFSGVLWVALSLLLLVLKLPWLSATLVAIACLMAARRMKPASFVVRASARSRFKDRALLWLLSLLQPIVREWARLAGMIKLGARPSFKPHLPDILPPSRPRKWTVTLGEWAFWSENNKGRDEWLSALRAMLIEQGIHFRDDDGWRWFDVEVHPARWRSYSALTMSEYHGQKKVLTRIKLQRRSSRMATCLLFLLVPLSVQLMLEIRSVVSFAVWLVPNYGMALIAVLYGIIFLNQWRVHLRYRNWINQAAQRAGLQPTSSRDDPVP
jgi:glycosyltransferase involved in cell wall biosynthesis/exo-beta-1,3-glucanase (GH17 family)